MVWNPRLERFTIVMKRSERLFGSPSGGGVALAATESVYLQDGRVEESDQQGPYFLMQMTALLCLYIAAFSVIDGFYGLYSYLAFSFGMADPAQSSTWQEAFTEFQNYPVRTLGFTLYNICIWNAVIICSIWMLRRRMWALHNLRRLLGLDMVVTVLNLCWPLAYALVAQTDLQARHMASPGLFIFLNALQVGAIIVLAQPRVQEAVEKSASTHQSKEKK